MTTRIKCAGCGGEADCRGATIYCAACYRKLDRRLRDVQAFSRSVLRAKEQAQEIAADYRTVVVDLARVSLALLANPCPETQAAMEQRLKMLPPEVFQTDET